MALLDLAYEELKQLPDTAVEQTMRFIQQWKHTHRLEREKALKNTCGGMNAEEADEFIQTIDEGCEQIDGESWISNK